MSGTTAAADGQPRRRLPRAEREQQLLDVAERVFAEQGIHGASMDEIAQRAGVSKPLLYDHFGSKDGLLVASFARVRAQLLADTQAALDGATTAGERLERGLCAFFDFVDEHEDSWSAVRTESAVSGAALAEVEAIRRQQAEYIAVSLAQDLVGVSPLDLEGLAEGIVGACERIALWRRQRPEVTSADATRQTMRLVWSGLAELQTPQAERLSAEAGVMGAGSGA